VSAAAAATPAVIAGIAIPGMPVNGHVGSGPPDAPLTSAEDPGVN
jgi:hypothetical protein